MEASQIWSSLPAVIEEYDQTTSKATVKPLIKMRYVDGSQKEFPPIYNVPVITPATAFAGMKLPVRVGDKVVLHIQDRDVQILLHKTTTEGLGNDDAIMCESARMHDLTDCVAYTGFGSFDSLHPSDYDVWIFNNDTPLPMWIDVENGAGTAGKGRFDSISLVWNYVLIPSFPELLVGEVVEDKFTFQSNTGDTYEVVIVLTGTGPLSPPTVSTAQGTVNGLVATGPLPPLDPTDSNYNHIRLKQNGDIEMVTQKATGTLHKGGNIEFRNSGCSMLMEETGNITMDTPLLTVTGGIEAGEDIRADGGNVGLLTHKHSQSGSSPVNPS